MSLDRHKIVPLIERYHAATRKTRAVWYSERERLSAKAQVVVTEIIHLLQQPDPSTRAIARTKLDELTLHISASLTESERDSLMDIFGWSHFGDMNIYGDDADSRANARSFARALEPVLAPHFNREAALLMLVRLYGSNITHIGPGITGLLYFLQPGLFPVMGQKVLRGFSRLFDKPVRSGKEGLKRLEDNLKLIWDLVDTYSDVIDAKDMADVSGFLYWIETSGALEEPSGKVQEKDATYTPDGLQDVPLSLTNDRMQKGLEEISLRLAISRESIEQAVVSLLTGKSLILTGPPGTGKTELARMIPTIFWNYYPMMTTATAEWTSYEVIGGLFPQIQRTATGDEHLGFTIRKGCVYEAVDQNWEGQDNLELINRRRKQTQLDGHQYDGVWLIIDEFNRADLDKAFGDLFTSLESGELRVPAIMDDNASSFDRIPIPQHFRIIGTLNTFDRHHLFEMSDALKRRFAFVQINPHPDTSIEKHLALDRSIGEIRRRNVEVDRVVLQNLADILFEWVQFVRVFRVIGTAQLISVLTYCGLRLSFDKDHMTALSEGIQTNIIPQLEGLTRDQLEAISLYSEVALEHLFEFFENRVKMGTAYRHDMKDLQRFMEYVMQNCTGAGQVLTSKIRDVISGGGEEVYPRLLDLMEGDESSPRWTDALINELTGTAMPDIARSIRELADESV